jgi:hypothetical protein
MMARVIIDPGPDRRDGPRPPRVIPTGMHGLLDYAASGINLLVPSLLGLESSSPSARALRLAGTAGAAYSLFTDYELGVVRVLPMRSHLTLDALKGVLLASSPWLVGYAGGGARHWLPHVLIGASDVLTAAISRTR